MNDLVTPNEIENEPKIDPEEEALSGVAHSSGWTVVKEYIAELIEELDGTVEQLMAKGANFEEIGQKSTVAAVTKGYLNRVLAKVEDAREAIDDARSKESK